jgi:dTDP-4-dehydrorhamnose reductase
MLGNDVMEVYNGYDLYGLSIADVDITDYNDLEVKVSGISPDVIINCAAYTDVDGCETEIDTAFNVNAQGVKNISLICSNNGAKLLHISTDYVFDGGKETPYNENDKIGPVSIYGKSKLKGEEYIKEILKDYLIVRTEWLFGKNGKNFVTTMLKLSEKNKTLTVVDDQFGSPTYTKDLATILKVMVDKNLSGIYHASNSGNTSWNGFAKKIFDLTKKSVQVDGISSDEFKRPARRPNNSIFDLGKLYKDTQRKMPDWQDALKRYLKEIKFI